jgi:zinc transporter ZupT
MALTGEKWGVMGMLAVVSIFLGFVPYFLVRWTKNSKIIRPNSTIYKLVLTILSCFGAGVLLSTALLLLLPEVRESLLNIPSVWETFDEHFPVAEMFAIAGFAMIYLVEEALSLYSEGIFLNFKLAGSAFYYG